MSAQRASSCARFALSAANRGARAARALLHIGKALLQVFDAGGALGVGMQQVRQPVGFPQRGGESHRQRLTRCVVSGQPLGISGFFHIAQAHPLPAVVAVQTRLAHLIVGDDFAGGGQRNSRSCSPKSRCRIRSWS